MTSKYSYKTPYNFEKEITKEYINSGIGVNQLSIKTSYSTQNIKNYKQYGMELSQFISIVAQNRMEHPSNEILRKVSKKVCIPHLVLNLKSIGYEDVFKNNLIQKLKKKEKFNILEKINSSIGITIIYTIMRCMDNYDIIIIPIGVSTDNNNVINHSNILIIDTRNQAKLKHNFKIISNKKNSKKKYEKYGKVFKCYLFEPNGIYYSKTKGINKTVNKYIKEANIILKKIDEPYILKDIEIIGGDGLQTELGAKILNGKKTIGKKGYPICGAIGYWIIYSWLKNGLQYTIKDYLNIVFKYINKNKKNRYILKDEIMNFIVSIRKYNEKFYKIFMNNKIIEDVQEYIKINNEYSEFSNNFELKINYEISSNINNKFNFNNKFLLNNKGLK